MIGVIGGTILLESQALEAPEARTVPTAFGPAEIDVGRIGGVPVAFIQRHGRRRDKPPHRIAHGANLAALKALGATHVVGLASTGCLRAEVELPALMVPHDYINWSDTTVFDDELVHVTPGFDEGLRRILLEEVRAEPGQRVLDRGVYFQARGPRLETRAEIAVVRTMADVVGMTAASEATVARELGLPYAALCTLDNYGHGVRDEVVDQARIQASATHSAAACVRILARVVRRLAS